MLFNCYKPLQFCFPASTRGLILLLSFAVLSSLFANLQLFNLAVLYTNQDEQRLFISKELVIDGIRTKEIGNINWQTTTPSPTHENEEEKDVIIQQKHSTNKRTTTKQINTLNNITIKEHLGTTKSDVLKDFWSELEQEEEIEEEEDEEKQLNQNKINNEENNNLFDVLGVTDVTRQKREIDENEDDEEFFEETFQPTLEFNWAQEKIRRLAQSLLFSSPGIAIMISHFPSYVILRRFGSHLPIFIVLLISSIITGGFPFILRLDAPFPLIMVSRILLGICFSPAFTFLGQMSAQWASVGEQHFFILTGFLALLFGPIISWGFTVSFLWFDSQSRIFVFGLHGALSLSLAFIWLILYRDQPQTHKLVNGEELHYIVKKKPRQKHSLLELNLPNSLACLLLRSTSAWAVWIASFCFFFALLTLLIFYPIFLHKIMKQTLNWWSLILPFVLLFLTFILSHFIYSFILHKKKLNILRYNTLIVRIFNTFAFTISAIIFLFIAMLPGNNENEQPFTIKWRPILLSISLFPLGLTSLGFIKSAVVSGGTHFTQYIISHMQLAFGLAYTLVPTILFSNISTSSVLVHWRLLFLICALLLILGLAIFAILGRGTATSWAEQWAQEAVGDVPLLFVKFSPQHQPIRSSATSPAAAQLASVASEAAAAGAALSSMHRYFGGERL